MLPNPSLAVTVKLPGIPAVVGEGKPATTNCGLTVTLVPPLMETVTVSVAATVWLPTDLRVAAKECSPRSD